MTLRGSSGFVKVDGKYLPISDWSMEKDKPALTPAQVMLREVLEKPFCRDTRLIYADFLEENGQGDRAELIRLQVARTAPDRIAAIYGHHYDRWMKAASDILGDDIVLVSFDWWLGFPQRVTTAMYQPKWMDVAAPLFYHFPITEVRFSTMQPRVYEDSILWLGTMATRPQAERHRVSTHVSATLYSRNGDFEDVEEAHQALSDATVNACRVLCGLPAINFDEVNR